MTSTPMRAKSDAREIRIAAYGTGEFFPHVSHDSFVSVVTRTKAFYETVFQQLGKLDLKPKPGSATRTSRFCRRP
jgi:hypothetical protein